MTGLTHRQKKLKLEAEAVTIADKLCQPEPYFRKGSDKPSFWTCGSCHRVYVKEEEARSCYTCSPRECKTCKGRIAPRSYCEPCTSARSHAKEQKALLDAASCLEMHKYDDPVIHDNEFHRDIDSLLDHLAYNEEDVPELVWACKRAGLTLESDDIIRSMLERNELPDEMDGDVELIEEKEFHAFIKQWIEKQSAYWWIEDLKTVVKIELPE
jgi:hypothetical protein